MCCIFILENMSCTVGCDKGLNKALLTLVRFWIKTIVFSSKFCATLTLVCHKKMDLNENDDENGAE